jgi:hypothetical protein
MQIIIYILLLAIIFALLLVFYKKRVFYQRKIDQPTVLVKPRKLLGKLILPNNEDYVLHDYEKRFGREDLLGFTHSEDLLYIGKEHFKLTRLDDGFYIEDLNTKNGTKVNGEDIRGLGKIKLRNGDQITMARIKIYYQEKTINKIPN